MDSTLVTTVVSTTTHTTFIEGVQQALSPMNWFFMGLGLFAYWSKTLNMCRLAANGEPYIKKFWQDNWIEMPTSLVSCLTIALLSKQIDTKLIDLHGSVTVFLVGYGNSSILNNFITQTKTSTLMNNVVSKVKTVLTKQP